MDEHHWRQKIDGGVPCADLAQSPGKALHVRYCYAVGFDERKWGSAGCHEALQWGVDEWHSADGPESACYRVDVAARSAGAALQECASEISVGFCFGKRVFSVRWP